MTEDAMTRSRRPDTAAAAARAAGAVAADLAAASRRARWVGPLFAVLAVLMVPWTVLPRGGAAGAGDGRPLRPRLGRLRRRPVPGPGVDRLGRGVQLTLAAGRRLAERGLPRRRRVVRRRHGTRAPRARDGPGLGALIELPLAAVSIWLAVNGQRIFEHQVTLRVLRRRHPRPARRR